MIRLFIACLLLIFSTQLCEGQYYYKDLVVTRQTAAQWRLYKDSKVRSVRLSSLEATGQPSEGFEGSQEMNADLTRITTHTRTPGTPDSWIVASYTGGQLTRIMDTSDTYQSVSDYLYDTQNRISSITNTSTETDNHIKDVEIHVWGYDAQGRASRMLKIRNGRDTTTVTFVTDEKGNIAEERSVHNGLGLPTVYYYYDEKGRLTDIVRYNKKAARLLPDLLFEYDGESNRPSSMLVVPEGSNDYQKWLYAYSDTGLKTKEACFNRQKQLLGKVEYAYTYR